MTGQFHGQYPGRVLGRIVGGLLIMAALFVCAIDMASAEIRVADEQKAWGAGIGFVDSRRFDEHYEKHGAEFGHITRQDYLRQAQLLRDARVGGPVLETVRADRVTTRYDRETGAFIAFNPDGTIRTFFKPNDGERYYRRQATRVGE